MFKSYDDLIRDGELAIPGAEPDYGEARGVFHPDEIFGGSLSAYQQLVRERATFGHPPPKGDRLWTDEDRKREARGEFKRGD